MLSDSQKVGLKVGLRLQRQITLSKPATQMEKLNANGRETRDITRAGMAGPTKKHPEQKTTEKRSDFLQAIITLQVQKTEGEYQFSPCWCHLFPRMARSRQFTSYISLLQGVGSPSVTHAMSNSNKPIKWRKQLCFSLFLFKK